MTLTMARGNFAFVLCLFLSLYSVYGFLENPGTMEERLAALETKLERVMQEVVVVQGCTSDFCNIHWTSWSAWSVWSHCSGQCNQGYGSREQSRTRTRVCLHQDQQQNKQFCNGTNAEVDKRPCNAVELYGCLNEQNTNNTNGNYALAYNFLDELAQSTCTAVLPSAAHAAAVRRDCYSGQAAQCTTICHNLGYTCFDELHVYHPSPLKPNVHTQTDEGKKGLSMFRYFGCTYGNGGCGPNYCCCKW